MLCSAVNKQDIIKDSHNSKLDHILGNKDAG